MVECSLRSFVSQQVTLSVHRAPPVVTALDCVLGGGGGLLSLKLWNMQARPPTATVVTDYRRTGGDIFVTYRIRPRCDFGEKPTRLFEL